LYKNILIATDGSDLATTAVKHGVDFAKEIGAKVTGVTVTEPFHLVSLAPTQLEYPRAEYRKDSEARAKKVLSSISAAANSAGVSCETLHGLGP
jgi:nucleotide-binding universal stress UspA family protein